MRAGTRREEGSHAAVERETREKAFDSAQDLKSEASKLQ